MLTTIHITVRDRVPTITAGEDVISHNSDYVAEFEFDEEWQDKVKTVYFVCEDGSYQAVVMSGNSCGVPMMAGEHRRIFVGVQAGSAEKPSVLKTTRPCCLKVKDSIADYLGQPIPDPSPDVYEQIIAMLESITSPTWDAVQNKPFSTLGGGLEVDENGVLSAQGGGGGSDNAVQYVAQELTEEQQKQARENIGAKAATDKDVYYISRTRSYGQISTYGLDFDTVLQNMKKGKVYVLVVDNYNTYYGVAVSSKAIAFYNINDIDTENYSGGQNKGIHYFGFTWRKDEDDFVEWWGVIPRISIDTTLTQSGQAADAKTVGDELTSINTELDNKLDNPQTAAVGDVLTVEEVDSDGKPTKWKAEAASGSAGEATSWVKLIDQTFYIENANSLSVDIMRKDAAKELRISLIFTVDDGFEYTGNAVKMSFNDVNIGYFPIATITKSPYQYFDISLEALQHIYRTNSANKFNYNFNTLTSQVISTTEQKNTGNFRLEFGGEYKGHVTVLLWGRYGINSKTETFEETDPTVPAWAKAATKPTYTAEEVGALPNTTVIPTTLPNPNKLTFTGAVAGEYDGSKAVTVEIGDAWETIAEGTVAESANLSINKDSDGNKFSLKSAVLLLSGAMEGDNSTFVRIAMGGFAELALGDIRASSDTTSLVRICASSIHGTVGMVYANKQTTEWASKTANSWRMAKLKTTSVSTETETIVTDPIASVYVGAWNGNGKPAAGMEYKLLGVRA